MNHPINDIHHEADETIQFSLDKTKHVNLKKPAAKITETSDDELARMKQEEAEEELLKNQATPTEFEDVFSDEEMGESEDNTPLSNVVGIEEVFETKASMINRDFHQEDGDTEAQPEHNPKLRKAAIILGIISGAIILAAIAIGIIIVL